ncbi:hypothetical protein GW17_00059284 [Ensete ventricosum]|nr:hypothetical protein GW17_00059284 [Ensete ventricosum]
MGAPNFSENWSHYRDMFYQLLCKICKSLHRLVSRVRDQTCCLFVTQIIVADQEELYANADQNYWKAISELIPREIPSIKKRGKKEEKKSSIMVVQGPKPGKPTDLSRMRQILAKLKHNTLAHLKPPPPPAPAKHGAAATETKQEAATTETTTNSKPST